ncbi:MAG: DUF3617 family protein, partial [Rhizobacter sp.]|nr:DUF3617 family protein [Rhizobacter sp.]
MNLRRIVPRSLATLVLCPIVAFAAGMAPGLWEHSVKFKSQSGDMEARKARMQAEIAAMPPERRKMVEEMMAKRGMSFDAQGT